jgi:uracil-DNA glycosylase
MPPSLRNILRELHDDAGVETPDHGTLTAWARRGVLLLNTVLTVREGEAGSHAGAGWEAFTDAVLQRVVAKRSRVVFLLLGNHARKKAESVDLSRHAVVQAPHPSPLSAHRGFFGSRIFSRTNALLEEGGRKPVDWSLPSLSS